MSFDRFEIASKSNIKLNKIKKKDKFTHVNSKER